MNSLNKTAFLSVLALSLCSGTIFGMNILEAAITGNYGRVLELLAKNPTLVNQRNRSGCTPLQLAAANNCDETVNALLAAGADANAQDDELQAALHHAIIFVEAFRAPEKQERIVALLLDAGARVNLQNKGGRTALHYAVNNGYEKIARMLVAAGADTTLKCCTPLEMASPSCKEFLEKWIQRRRLIAAILARALHQRLGARSPLRDLPQDLLKEITILTGQAEALCQDTPRRRCAIM
jgi:hypothetical protein